jgi:hypothetical protein
MSTSTTSLENELVEEEVTTDVVVDTVSDSASPSQATTTEPGSGDAPVSEDDSPELLDSQLDDGGGADEEVIDTEDSAPPLTEDDQSTNNDDAPVSGDNEVVVTDDAIDDEVLEPTLTEPVTVTYSDSGYVFSKSECTELASGSFYCIEPKNNVLSDALFAAPDADGDLEIFLVRDGVQTQVTQNLVDDAAPYYDQNSETIVWHRLIDDRYQIVSYEISSGEETVLTHNNTNDMEPTRQGVYTVWQRWVGNNWDIILFDGKREVQVSHSLAHDIAPYIHGTLVVWNRYTMSGDKTIEMFDLASETYVTVDDPTGLSVSNPRMVLVYDQLHPNGDVVTKGYDMIARTFIALDTLPRQLPEQLPQSEPTPETRALIQSKPTIKGDEVTEPEPLGDDALVPGTASSSEPIVTDPLTLDLTSTSTTSTEPMISEITEFDLVIEPLSTASGTDNGVQASTSEQ